MSAASFTPLPREFYARSVLDVARDCVGKILVHETPEGLVAARIVETEAYRGPEDLAAHSAGGRRTKRTEAMFGPPGHAYMFLLYGMHWAFNLVAGPEGHPHAVLVRAAEPVSGVEIMAARRGVAAGSVTLCNGPGSSAPRSASTPPLTGSTSARAASTSRRASAAGSGDRRASTSTTRARG